MRRVILLCGLVGTFAATARADTSTQINQCRQVQDSLARLTCYDKIVTAPSDQKASRLTSPPSTDGAPIKLAKATLSAQPKNLDMSIYSPRIELRLRFMNSTEKAVVALGLNIVVKDAFGDEAVNENGKLDIAIPPGGEADSPSFYYWEDNQFISQDPYSKMIGAVDAGTAKAEVRVTRAIYRDGTSDDF